MTPSFLDSNSVNQSLGRLRFFHARMPRLLNLPRLGVLLVVVVLLLGAPPASAGDKEMKGDQDIVGSHGLQRK